MSQYSHRLKFILRLFPHGNSCRIALAIALAALLSGACGMLPEISGAALPTSEHAPAHESQVGSDTASALLTGETGSAAASTSQTNTTSPSVSDKISPTDPPATGLPSLSATAVPTSTPGGPRSTTTRSPRTLMTSDLLFLADGKLIRWDPRTRYGVTLAENVVQFSTNLSGKSVALLRRTGVAANGVELFDLDLLNFETKQVQTILHAKPDLSDLALSPDGEWLAYRTPQDQGKILVMQAADPETVFQPGSCLPADGESSNGRRCSGPVWSPDSKALLWSDRRGLWLVQSIQTPAQNLNAGRVELSDPEGKPVWVEAGFSEPRWSPLGRFALVRVRLHDSAVSWHSVLDTKTGRLVQVIDSFAMKETDASIAWLRDGRFAVAHASQPVEDRPAGLQLWSVVPTHTELLLAGPQYKFDHNTVLAGLKLEDALAGEESTICVEWIQPSHAELLGAGLRILSANPQPFLFEIDSLKGSLTALAELPAETRTILWSPDGTGVLLISQERQLSYLDLETLEMIELKSEMVLPGDAAWLPPVMRK